MAEGYYEPLRSMIKKLTINTTTTGNGNVSLDIGYLTTIPIAGNIKKSDGTSHYYVVFGRYSIRDDGSWGMKVINEFSDNGIAHVAANTQITGTLYYIDYNS